MPRKKLVLFTSPNFEAYFSDVMMLQGKADLRFAPILDWDSQIIFSCFVAVVSIFDVANIYQNHALFQAYAMKKAVERALVASLRRDEDVEIPITRFMQRNFAQMRLFHSWLHPIHQCLYCCWLAFYVRLICRVMNVDLSLQWKVLDLIDGLFAAGMAYYNFCVFHPHVVAQKWHLVIPI